MHGIDRELYPDCDTGETESLFGQFVKMVPVEESLMCISTLNLDGSQFDNFARLPDNAEPARYRRSGNRAIHAGLRACLRKSFAWHKIASSG